MLFAVKKRNKILDQINALSDAMRNLSDSELQHKTIELKTRAGHGESSEHLLPEAFAAIREACFRVLGVYAFDVQVLGAIVLQAGQIAEIKTGEGKTLTAVMPLYLNALTGKSAILVTADPYLACRDAEYVAPVFNWMGLSLGVGVRTDGEKRWTVDEKRKLYASDVVYTTARALALDYLLENLATDTNQQYLRDYDYVLIDEADSVLLDDAQSPLLVYGSPRVQSNVFHTADYFVGTLEKPLDYTVEEAKVWLTASGRKKAEKFYAVDCLYQEKYYDLTRHILLALRAHALFKRDRQYIVEDDRVKLLDRATGRIMEDAKLPGGQHQALEAKEAVKITLENRAIASITYPAFFKMFKKMAGMSGAIYGAAQELKAFYQVDVIQIPTNRPIQREDRKDSIYTTTHAQVTEAMNWLQKYHDRGQPVWMVTSTLDISRIFSDILSRTGIPHQVLNPFDRAEEAAIVRKAGQRGAVTIAPAGAGRDMDIRLGDGVEALGGLVVLGVGKMANARQERLNRERAGRQGNRGMSKFFIALEDAIVLQSGSNFLAKYRKEDSEIHSRRVRREVNRIQRQNEDRARFTRGQMLAYDRSLSEQRDIIYDFRQSLIEGEDIAKTRILQAIQKRVHRFLQTQKRLHVTTLNRFVLDHINYNFNGFSRDIVHKSKQAIENQMMNMVNEQLYKKEQQLSSKEHIQTFYRLALLHALDHAWAEQVDYMQQLRMIMSGQRHKMNDFHREAYRSFQKMLDMFTMESMRNLLLGTVHYDNEEVLQVQLP